ncbi:MAG: VWA domain-containing protein [Campylobacterales bacterium]|nr:VWA domain-containing protein [Campylobacterales bacterium]
MFDFFHNITLQYPYFLLLILLFAVCFKFCKPKTQTYYMPHLAVFQNTRTLSTNLSSFLKYTTVIFAIIALSSPIKELHVQNIKKDGIDMVLSLDTSGSMKQIGFDSQNPSKNRWEAVQQIVQNFIEKRVNDNIGLVVFGSSVMTASALSYDKQAQGNILQGLDVGVVGEKTALIDSIATSVNILKNSKAQSKIVIVLTDGDDTASTIPLQVVTKLAKKYNIKIYCIAIGALNRYVLDELSAATGGKTFIATSSEDLQKVYKIIDELEKSKIDENRIVLKEYLFFYPLFVAFLSLVFFVYLQNKRGGI